MTICATLACLQLGAVVGVVDAERIRLDRIGEEGELAAERRLVRVHEISERPAVVDQRDASARELAAQYGERFEPPASLVAKAEAGETYSDAPAPATA